MKIFLKILKGVLYAGAVVCFVFFIIFLISGIYNACVADDIITAQDRTKAAYEFIKMVIFAGSTLACLLLTLFIKEPLLPFIENVKENEN